MKKFLRKFSYIDANICSFACLCGKHSNQCGRCHDCMELKYHASALIFAGLF